MKTTLAIWLWAIAAFAGQAIVYDQTEYARRDAERTAIENARDATSNCSSNLADAKTKYIDIRTAITNLNTTVWPAGEQRNYMVTLKQAQKDQLEASRDQAQAIRDLVEALRELLRIQAGRP